MENPLVRSFSLMICTSSPEGTIYAIFDSTQLLIIVGMEMGYTEVFQSIEWMIFIFTKWR